MCAIRRRPRRSSKQVAKLGDQSIGVEADVSKLADLQMLVDRTVSKFGRVGVGRITTIRPAKLYDVPPGNPAYIMWDRLSPGEYI